LYILHTAHIVWGDSGLMTGCAAEGLIYNFTVQTAHIVLIYFERR
jgi:hypothetical protein